MLFCSVTASSQAIVDVRAGLRSGNENHRLVTVATFYAALYRSRWAVTSGLNGSNDSFIVQAMARSRMIRK